MSIRKKIIICLFCIIGTFLLFQNSVEAASAKISVSNKNPKPGEKVTVTGSVTAGAWNLKLSGNGKSETIYGYTNTNGNASGSKSITFTAGEAGEKYSFVLNGGMTDIKSDSEESVSKSVSIVVAKNETKETSSDSKKEEKNNSNNSSKTSDETKKQTSKEEDEKEPTFQDVNQIATVTGNVNFRKSYSTQSASLGMVKEGENVTILGNGDNGWSKVEYNGKTGYIKTSYLSTTDEGTEVEEIDQENVFGLESLKIKDFNLTPEFSTDIYEYTINSKEEIKELNIEQAIANSQTARVEITGNENFVEGKNVVKIDVIDENQEKTALYQIIVNIEKNQQAEKIDSTVFDEEANRIQKDLNLRKWVIRAIIIFVTIIIIIMCILRYRTVRSEQDGLYGKNDGYVIIDEMFDLKERIAKIERMDEEIDENKDSEESNIEKTIETRKSKRKRGKHF